MAKEPLIQARIRTRLGNIVTRHVKPDNPNIVEVLTTVIDGQQPPLVQQAARRARTIIKPKAPKADPVVVKPTEPKLIRTDWQEVSHHGCCGGRVLIAHDIFEAEEKPFDEAALRDEWERHQYGEKYWKIYMGYTDQPRKALEYLIKNGRNLENYGGYRREMFQADITYYEGLAKEYSWEEALKRKSCYGVGAPRYLKPETALMGVTVSIREFPGSHQSPAGLWMRSDQEPGTSNKMRLKDMAKAVEQPVKIVANGRYIVNYQEPLSTKPTDHWILSGMSRGLEQAACNWKAISNLVATKKAKAGTLITFILNHSQNNKAVDESLAEAGFQCVLCTGNKNHGNSSVLYLYERRLTERDIELLNG